MTADVSSNLYDWSTTASSNQPDGTDALSNLDDNLREIQAVLRGFLFSKGADIASAAEPDPKISGLVHEITGTTTITGFATATGGMWKIFRMAANPMLKNSTALALPGAADIQAATGDYMLAVSITSTGIWHVPFYQTVTDRFLAQNTGPLTRGTSTATTSGTSIGFSSIPSWVNKITISLSNVSTNGTSPVIIQIGDSGGIEATGYTGGATYSGTGVAPNGTNNSTGFLTDGFAAATNTRCGHCTLTHLGSNVWVFSSVINETADTNAAVGGGVKTLSGTLDRLQITTVGGVNTFDAGTINIIYE